MEKKIRYIYRITNLINGKTYIGQRTPNCENIEDDNYYGSGKLIKLAEQKYGISNFRKDIIVSGLYTKVEIDKLEIEYILKEKELGHSEYNISTGGQQGGNMGEDWLLQVKIANQQEPHKEKLKLAFVNFKQNNPERWKEIQRERLEAIMIDRANNPDKYKTFLGKKHSDATKQKMSEAALKQDRTGNKNGSFGKHWFTNGKENIKCESCPEGFYPGRNDSFKKKIELEKKKEAKESFERDLIDKILNCGVDLQAYNVYNLLAQKLGLKRTFIRGFVKNHMEDYKNLFYNRKEHMSK